MAIRQESIVAMLATSMEGLVVHMSNKALQHELFYQATMSLLRSLLKNGTITLEEYNRCNVIFLEKYNNKTAKLYTI